MEAATHLARVKSEMYERQWERFNVRRPARLMAVKPGLTGITLRSCQVLDISQGGAGIEVSTTIGLSQHYYLQIFGLADRIGCAEAYRNGSRVGVKFIMPITEALLRRIVRTDFVMSDGPLKPIPGSGGQMVEPAFWAGA